MAQPAGRVGGVPRKSRSKRRWIGWRLRTPGSKIGIRKRRTDTAAQNRAPQSFGLASEQEKIPSFEPCLDIGSAVARAEKSLNGALPDTRRRTARRCRRFADRPSASNPGRPGANSGPPRKIRAVRPGGGVAWWRRSSGQSSRYSAEFPGRTSTTLSSGSAVHLG